MAKPCESASNLRLFVPLVDLSNRDDHIAFALFASLSSRVPPLLVGSHIGRMETVGATENDPEGFPLLELIANHAKAKRKSELTLVRKIIHRG